MSSEYREGSVFPTVWLDVALNITTDISMGRQDLVEFTRAKDLSGESAQHLLQLLIEKEGQTWLIRSLSCRFHLGASHGRAADVSHSMIHHLCISFWPGGLTSRDKIALGPLSSRWTHSGPPLVDGPNSQAILILRPNSIAF